MQKFITSDYAPCAESDIKWVFIDLPGKDDLNGKPRFVASLYLKTDSDGCKALKKLIDDFWAENKPKGAKCKSLGYRVAQEKNVDGEYEDTDETAFNFWTGTTYKDGNTRTIDVYNAKGSKVSLGGKKIGNGSKGAISGTMAIYDNGPAARGVTLYLNAIQLTKFVEFSTDAGFGSQDDAEEDAFEGVDSEFEGTSEEAPEGKPNL